ncbi:MAG: radical SAM protein [Alphaproteobacteria bacterium]|nr:MAG: radical SAM protein [Alphaproteobacteria bacterium]
MKTETKFSDPTITATGEKRAWVDLTALKTLWFNTGTLCNLACVNCYIESTPKNDALVYLTHGEVITYLNEIAKEDYPTEEIGITGGEPFMNPDIIPIIEECLERGFKLLVLTNAMRPMMKYEDDLLRLKDTYASALTLRISVDHFKRERHEEERGPRSWEPMVLGLKWLSNHDFTIDIAGRTLWGEEESELRQGFDTFLKQHNIKIDAHDKKQLMLFPEMDENVPVPEITTACWGILNVDPDDMMCASSRMVVKRKGDEKLSVMACTLLAYDQQFNMGKSLKEASKAIHLNHPHCSKFCVLGGGACSISEA